MDQRTREIYEKCGINPEEREIENQKIIDEHYNNIDSENKESLENLFKKALEENFDHYKHYLQSTRFYYFTDLELTIGEIIKCLIIEAHTAAITLTNHFLERILKLALIQKKYGTEPKKTKDWNETYSEPLINNRISTWKMSVTIKKCKEYKIISKIQFNELTNFQTTIRNGFSHYDPEQILKDSEDTIDLIDKSDFENKKIKGIIYKEIPTLQNFFVRKFARENSKQYFDYVFNLMLDIERYFKTEYYKNAE